MKKPLLIIILISALVYALNTFNDELITKGKSKWYLLRHIITGAIGSAFFVWWIYEALRYYALPDNLCLATAGAVGYLGADVTTRFVEKFVEKLLDRIK